MDVATLFSVQDYVYWLFLDFYKLKKCVLLVCYSCCHILLITFLKHVLTYAYKLQYLKNILARFLFIPFKCFTRKTEHITKMNAATEYIIDLSTKSMLDFTLKFEKNKINNIYNNCWIYLNLTKTLNSFYTCLNKF